MPIFNKYCKCYNFGKSCFLLGEGLKMLKISILEFFLRAIPESFLIVFFTYIFSKTAINKKRYALSSILATVFIYTIRCLPINLGVHTILGIVIMIILNVNINKIHVIKAIRSTIIAFALEFICEILNVVIIQNVLGLDMKNAFHDNVSRLLYSSPSLIMFALVVLSYYFILLKKRKFDHKIEYKDAVNFVE